MSDHSTSEDQPDDASAGLLTTAQAAQILGMTDQGVLYQMRQGRIRPAQTLPVGRGLRYLWNRAAVEAYARMRRAGQAQDEQLAEQRDSIGDDET